MRYHTYELKSRNSKKWDILHMSSQIEKLLEMRYPTYDLKLKKCKKWDITHMSSNWEIARNEISYIWAQIEKL